MSKMQVSNGSLDVKASLVKVPVLDTGYANALLASLWCWERCIRGSLMDLAECVMAVTGEL